MILHKFGLYKRLAEKKDLSKYLGVLEFNARPEIAYRLFWCRRISTVLIIILAFNLLSMLFVLTSGSSLHLTEGKYVKRPGHGQGASNIELQVMLINNDNLSKTDKKEKYGPYELRINVSEQAYSDDELKQLFPKAYSYIKSKVLGENTSFDRIYSKLNFIKTVPGTGIKVRWIPDDYGLIRSDGSIINENIETKGIWTNVTAVLTYELDGLKHSREYIMSFKIMPRQYNDEELLQKRLIEAIDTADEKSREDGSLQLPEKMDGYTIVWSEKKKGSSNILFLMGIILAAAAWAGADKEIDNKLKKRKEQMLIDYPEIVNKFALLINAGMTIKQAWLKIADDYERLIGKANKRRHAYEEIVTTARELRLGVPESEVYEKFGKRTGLIQYIKFVSLLNQNLKKGTRNITQQLMYEAQEAFEERKELAKRLGETAGTRLLGPMMAMLLIVLLMIMIPAFMSFGI